MSNSVRRGLTGIAALVLCLSVVFGVTAQDDPQGAPLPEETVVYGQLVPNEFDAYVHEAYFGDVLTINLQSDDFDPTLEVFFDGQRVALDDDSGIGDDARLIFGPIERGGEYTIFVTGAFPNASGRYALKLEDQLVQNASGLSFNRTIVARMGPDNIDRWRFVGEIGEFIQIVAENEDGPLDVELVNDGENFNAGTNGITEPDNIFEITGITTYIAVITPSLPDNDLAGTIYRLEAWDKADNVPVEADTINRGRLIQRGDVATYRLLATAGQSVEISARSEAFDPTLRVLDAEGNVLAEDDDSGVDFLAAQADVTFPAEGFYTIEISAFGDDVGEYELRVFTPAAAADGDAAEGEEPDNADTADTEGE